jgi:hypothetical protein
VKQEGPVKEEAKPEPKPGADHASTKAKPEDYMCFGTIQPEHSECKECPLRQQCANKAGVKI